MGTSISFLEIRRQVKRMKSEGDSLALLVALWNKSFNFHKQKDQVKALQEAVRHFHLIKQEKTDSCQVLQTVMKLACDLSKTLVATTCLHLSA